jgi:hypothetical protein
MKILKAHSYLMAFALIVSACSTTRFTKTITSPLSQLNQSDKVYFQTPNEQPAADWVEIGDFEHVEDHNTSWSYLTDKIGKKALESGANIVKINIYRISGKTKGHMVLITGKFYLSKESQSTIENYIKTEREKEVTNCNCYYVQIFREEGSGGNAGIRAAFKMDASVNDSIIGALTNRKAYSVKMTKETDLSIGASGKTDPKIIVKGELGKIYYLWATANTRPSKQPPADVIAIPLGARREFYLHADSPKMKAIFETLLKGNE